MRAAIAEAAEAAERKRQREVREKGKGLSDYIVECWTYDRLLCDLGGGY